jgi:hypothetical protein
MADLIPVTFNEGEPLDVTKLNNLRLNITNTYATAASLQNATLDGKSIPVIDFGTVTVKTVANKASEGVNLPINPNFSGTPMFFVSIGGGSTKDAQITLGIRNANSTTSSPQVYAISTVGNLTITVNYIAIQKKSA